VLFSQKSGMSNEPELRILFAMGKKIEIHKKIIRLHAGLVVAILFFWYYWPTNTGRVFQPSGCCTI